MKREEIVEQLAETIFEAQRPNHHGGWDVHVSIPGNREHWHRVANAALARLDSLGMVVVPKEPTREQLEAARDWSVAKYGIGVGNEGAEGCYRAMLSPSGGGI